MANTKKDLSTVTAMVCDNGLFVAIAQKLAETYKKVYYHVPSVSAFPKMNLAKIGQGLPGIEVASDILGNDFDDDIDIYIFLDVGFGPIQTHLESLGKRVWGSRNGENFELDRVGMKELMREKGLPVGPYRTVKGVAALREHLKGHKEQFVKISRYRGSFESFFAPDYKFVEPKLDEVEYNLGAFKHDTEFVVEDSLKDKIEFGCDTYCIDGQFPKMTIAGPEIKDRGFVGIFKPRAELPEPLTRFDRVMAPTLKQFRYRGFYSTEVRIGKDHIPYMIDHCFDDQTEVLSERGWIPFSDCTLQDKLATLNTATRAIEYEAPERVIARPYDGEMIRLTNPKRSIDCVVTPGHSVLRYDRNKIKLFKEPAAKLTDKGFIPRTGLWTPQVVSTHFSLPEYHHEWDFHGQYGHKICRRVKHESAVDIPLTDWAAFLAWFLSEGSTSSVGGGSKGSRAVTQISQTKHPEIVRTVLSKLPFKFSYKGGVFRISSTQLSTYLHSFGLCSEKFIPAYIKNASRDVIRVFLDNYCLGDGSQRGSRKSYFTTSKRMADDLQELIFKSGAVANLIVRPTKGTVAKINGRSYVRNHDSIMLEECRSFTDFWFETAKRKARYVTSIPYRGMVYCATVPNGTLYVRRNGKPFWSGNCSRLASPPSELYCEFYTNLAAIVWEGAGGVCIDPKPIAKYGAEALIHSSWADKNFQPIDIPESIRRHVKLRNAMFTNGRFYVIPQAVGLPEVGAVVGWGDTLDAAVEMVRTIAEQVKGYYLEVTVDAFDAAEEEIAKGEKYGLKMF